MLYFVIDFQGLLPTLSHSQLREFSSFINLELIKRQTELTSATIVDSEPTYSPDPKNIDDFVEYREHFINKTEGDIVLAECESFNFIRKTKSEKVQNRFLSFGEEPYSWNSRGGTVDNHPLDLDQHPGIRDLLHKVNSEFNCKLNSALVSFYRNGSVSARLHKDDEESLDPSEPIVVVSIGAVRRVEFVGDNQESFRSNARILDPQEFSAYVMKAGCQDSFRHRVRMNRKVKGSRISISFRAFVAESERHVSFCPKPEPTVSQLNNTDCVTPKSSKPSSGTVTDEAPKTSDQGFSRFQTSPLDSSWAASSAAATMAGSGSNEKLCLLLGTSITQNVDGALMSKKNRTVINLSASGANIEHLRKIAGDFYYENPYSVHKVDKIVVNVGTNEIKWYNCHTRNLRRDFKHKLVELVRDLNLLFPRAHISFVTVLPIRIIYNYTVDSVHQFNNLILEVCTQYGCTFFDCFARFLDREGVHPNRLFYRDNWHINSVGLKVLCRALKFLIYGNIFNPMPRYSIYDRSYPFNKY